MMKCNFGVENCNPLTCNGHLGQAEAQYDVDEKPNWLEQANIDQKNLLEFEQELTKLINKYSLENGSGTPDHMLASFLVKQINVWNLYVPMRDRWHGISTDRFGMPVKP